MKWVGKRDERPCDICPIEIKKKCEVNKLCRDIKDEEQEEFANKELSKFENDIKTQEKRVHEKINPILELYDQGKINRKELAEKLSEAFYDLERND
jgi:hypothetical protein